MNELEQSLVRWAQAGLVTEEQAQRIRDFEQGGLPPTDDFGVSVAGPVEPPVQDFVVAGSETSQDPRPDRSAIAMEAIAYVGGIFFVIGYAVVSGSQWGNMNNVGHFLLAIAPAIVTFVAGIGFGAHTVPSFRRIGYVLWALSTVFFAFAVGVAVDGFFDLEADVAAVTLGVIVTSFAVGQYAVRRSALQQLLAFAAIATLSAALLHLFDNSADAFWYGVLVVVQGLAWLLFTWADVVRPRRAGFVQGGIAALVATQAMAFSMTDEAIVIGAALSLLFLVIGVTGRVIPLFALGAIGLFAFVYEGVLNWFGSSVLTNSILLVVGLFVLGGVVVRLQLVKAKS